MINKKYVIQKVNNFELYISKYKYNRNRISNRIFEKML